MSNDTNVLKDRLLPYKILTYLLYSKMDFIKPLPGNEVRLITGPASRALYVKSHKLWESLFWLEKQNLVELVRKEEKRGAVKIKLLTPTNILPTVTLECTPEMAAISGAHKDE